MADWVSISLQGLLAKLADTKTFVPYSYELSIEFNGSRSKQ